MKGRRALSRLLAAAGLSVSGVPEAHASPEVRVMGAPEDVRIHGSDEVRVPRATKALSLRALADETIGFQVYAESDVALDDVRVEVVPLLCQGGDVLAVDGFVEHYVDVKARTRNLSGEESTLAFTRAAMPRGAEFTGMLPDALVPLEFAECHEGEGRAFCLYPMKVPAHTRRAVWFDVHVPEGHRGGDCSGAIDLFAGDRHLGRVSVDVDVIPERLPFRATSAFAYYEWSTLQHYFRAPEEVERELWRMLHAHRLDAIVTLRTREDVARIHGALDGSWFSSAEGYVGPGRGEAPRVVAFGAYGALGAPTEEAVAAVRSMASLVPSSIPDVFVYAVDETCKSPLGPDWKRALAAAGLSERVMAAHTCGEDPRHADVDLAMMPAQAFSPSLAKKARALGKRVFVYNGQLPHSGSMMLDVPMTSLTMNGWIAARYDVDRWFYWESVYWQDHGRGGHGPRDVFDDPETFHNADGDVCLYDGLLVYPGRMPPGVGASLERDVVLPSLRLKALRRGIADGSLIARASEVDLESTRAIVSRVVPYAFDEVRGTRQALFSDRESELPSARDALRDIIVRSPRRTRGDRPPSLDRLHELLVTPPRSHRPLALVPLLGLGCFAVGWLVLRVGSSRRRSVP